MTDDRPTERDSAVSRNNRQQQARQQGITLSELYRLLANGRRRVILEYLMTHPADTVRFDDLVSVVAESESPKPGPKTHRHRVRTDVFHVQLPTLADAGVVTHDPNQGTVQYHGSARLEELLRRTDSIDTAAK